MQNLQLIVMQHVDLISAPCWLVHSPQLDEAAKALHTTRVIVATVARRPRAFMSSFEF
jgi:hypothetical protein